MVVVEIIFKPSRVAEIVTTVSMSWEGTSVSGQKMWPLQQYLVQEVIWKRRIYLSCLYLVKSQSPHSGQLAYFRYCSLSRYSVF